jgi:formylglycine-generating enzyme required for sulfatase activity
MGSAESGAAAGEKPLRRVTVKSFAVGKFEVTNRQFLEFLNSTKAFDPRWLRLHSSSKESVVKRDGEPSSRQFHVDDAALDLPIVSVSWEGASRYADWLAQKTKRKYRLPSEAEWEYAARAGGKSAFYFGDEAKQVCAHANVADLSANDEFGWRIVVNCRDGFAGLAKPGSFAPNAFGLHDILGNASEWVADCANNTYGGAPVDGSAWLTGDCVTRIVRGGSYSGTTVAARSAARESAGMYEQINVIGFRVGLSLSEN